MIWAVGADKGAPGASTVALALSVVLPGRRVLVEADPSGADVPLRLRDSAGGWLAPQPWLGSLAAAVRLGGADPYAFAQNTLLGVPVVPGGLGPDRFAPLRALWGQVAAALSASDGAVVADLGRLHAGHAAAPVLSAAAVALVVGRGDVAGLSHLRDRVAATTAAVPPGPGGAPSVLAVIVSDRPRPRREAAEAAQVLAAAGLPCPVAGVIPHDPAGAAALWSGPLTRKLAGSPLLRAARQVAAEVLRVRPDVAAALTPSPNLPDAPHAHPAPAAEHASRRPVSGANRADLDTADIDRATKGRVRA